MRRRGHPVAGSPARMLPQPAGRAAAQPGEALARGAAAVLEAAGFACLFEFPLGNGRRVDVIGIDERGRIAIVEVKSSVADYRADAKWTEYLPFCDLFFFAVPEDFPLGLFAELDPWGEAIGIMVVDRHDGAVRRPARLTDLHPARRRALTLRFARTAARRLRPRGTLDEPWP